VARTAALLRRGGRKDIDTGQTQGIHSGDVTLDPERREAFVRGAPVELTKQEFDLLFLLASRRGIVFSRAALLAKVWSGDTDVTERTVDTVVSRLRRKIERDPQDPELILTAWGVGYKCVDVE
jgi:DNA-binding response OmpR family regulator